MQSSPQKSLSGLFVLILIQEISFYIAPIHLKMLRKVQTKHTVTLIIISAV